MLYKIYVNPFKLNIWVQCESYEDYKLQMTILPCAYKQVE